MKRVVVRVAVGVCAILAAGTLSACGIFISHQPPVASSHDTNTQTIDMPAGSAVIVTNNIGSTEIWVDPAATQATVEVRREAVADTQDAADALLATIGVFVTAP